MAAAAAPAALVPLAEGAEQPAFKKVKLKLAPKPRKKRGPMPQKHHTCPHKKCQGKVFVGRACFNKHMKGHTPLPPSQACLGCGYNPCRVTSAAAQPLRSDKMRPPQPPKKLPAEIWRG